MISNEVYEAALYDPNNIRIMSSACDAFRGILDTQILDTCKLYGLLECLEKHDDNLGQKFTSSLYQHVMWKCQQAVDEKVRTKTCCELTIDPIDDDSPMDTLLVEDCLSLLDEREADMVRDRYIYGLTYAELATKYECSDNGAKFIVERSVNFLRSELSGV